MDAIAFAIALLEALDLSLGMRLPALDHGLNGLAGQYRHCFTGSLRNLVRPVPINRLAPRRHDCGCTGLHRNVHRRRGVSACRRHPFRRADQAAKNRPAITAAFEDAIAALDALLEEVPRSLIGWIYFFYFPMDYTGFLGRAKQIECSLLSTKDVSNIYLMDDKPNTLVIEAKFEVGSFD